MTERQPLFEYSDDPDTPLFNELNAGHPLRSIMGVPITEEDLQELADKLTEVDEAERMALHETQDIILRDGDPWGVQPSAEADAHFDEINEAIERDLKTTHPFDVIASNGLVLAVALQRGYDPTKV